MAAPSASLRNVGPEMWFPSVQRSMVYLRFSYSSTGARARITDAKTVQLGTPRNGSPAKRHSPVSQISASRGCRGVSLTNDHRESNSEAPLAQGEFEVEYLIAKGQIGKRIWYKGIMEGLHSG